MNIAYLSALSALCGSALGALGTIVTTWLTQRYQDRATRRASESHRREQLFGEFIDLASKLLGDALTHSLDDPAKLVPLYATLGKLRLFASKETIKSAKSVLERIVVIYDMTNKDFRAVPVEANGLDILDAFTQICRTELAG
jgi:hypothetical protein